MFVSIDKFLGVPLDFVGSEELLVFVFGGWNRDWDCFFLGFEFTHNEFISVINDKIYRIWNEFRDNQPLTKTV